MGYIYKAVTTPGKKILTFTLCKATSDSLKFLGAFPVPSEASTLLSVKSLHEIQLGVKG